MGNETKLPSAIIAVLNLLTQCETNFSTWAIFSSIHYKSHRSFETFG